MSDAIVYCDECNRIILPSEIKDGSAVITPVKSLCPECLKALATGECQTLRKLSEEEAARSEEASVGEPDAEGRKRGRSSTGHRRAAVSNRQSSAWPKIIAGVGVVGFAVAGIVLLTLDTDDGPTSSVPPPRVPSPPPAMGQTNRAPADAAQMDVAATDVARTDEAETEPTAASELDDIRRLITPGLDAYDDIRARLAVFPARFGGSPQEDTARKLLADLDERYAALAEEALAQAVAGADACVARGDYQSALSFVRGVANQYGDGPWLGETGNAKIAAAVEAIEAKRRGARGDAPRRDVAAPGQDARAEATTVSDDRNRLLGEFDRLMTARAYAKARAHAESVLADVKGGDGLAGALRSAARVARAMAEFPAARTRGAKTLVGREERLRLRTAAMDMRVGAVDDDGLETVTTFTINNQTRERKTVHRWDAFHPEQLHEFARLGGVTLEPAEWAIASAYEALAAGDLDRAETALAAPRDVGLGEHLAGVVGVKKTQLAYGTAMARATDLAGKKRWKEAVAECRKALAVRPNDADALKLLEKAEDGVFGLPRKLKLDLGNGVTMVFVLIKPGVFTMGGAEDPGPHWQGVEKPKHEVAITRPFYMGTYEVTERQYETVMGTNPSEKIGPDRPIEQTSWADAVEFCRRLSAKTGRTVRLPTEAEWEYAARAGATTRYCYGDDDVRLGEYAKYKGAQGAWEKRPVGEKKPNAWGLYDVHGNVSEWVADWYDAGYYATGPHRDPTGPANGTKRILRGGSWTSLKASECRLAYRHVKEGSWKYLSAGFRVAVTP